MNGLDRSTSTGQPGRARRADRREPRPGRAAGVVGCGGASIAGVTVIGVLLAGMVSAANSCGAIFRPACERSSDGLHRAAYAGDIATVRDELGAGADPDRRDGQGLTALACAAEGGQLDVASALVDGGATGRALSAERQTRLFVAAVSEDRVEATVAFLDHGFDINAAADEPVIATAIRTDARRSLVEIIRRGGSADDALHAAITDASPAPPLSFLTLTTWATAVPPSAPIDRRLALTDLFLDLGAQPGRHDTVVAAAGLREPGFIIRLLDRGADPDAGDGAPLRAAAAAGSTEVVRALLARGANPNLSTTGPSALVWASMWGHHDIVDQLLAAHADPNGGGHVSRAEGAMAIAFASSGQPVVATQYVTQAFATFPEGGNVPPLVAAATFDHWDIAAKLLVAGADPDGRAGSLTAVGAAAAFDHPVTVKLLLESGASPTSPDPAVPDPVVIAERVGATEVVALLRAPR